MEANGCSTKLSLWLQVEMQHAVLVQMIHLQHFFSTATPKSAQCMSWGSSCSEHLLDILACDDKFGRKACEVSSLTPSSPFGLVRSVLLHCSITHPGCASRLSSDFKGPTNVVEIQSGPDLLLATLSLRHGIVSRPLTANVIHTNRNYTEHV